MRVLYVTSFSPWKPKYGGALRSFGIIRGIGEQHELHVALTPHRQEDAEAFRAQAQPGLAQIHVLQSGTPFVTGKAGNSALAQAKERGTFRSAFYDLTDRIKPDVIWCCEKRAFRSIGSPKGLPTIIDFVDVPWRKLLRTSRFEQGLGRLRARLMVAPLWLDDQMMARKARVVVLANPEETGLLRLANHVIPLPNGFDFPDQLSRRAPQSRSLVFFGSLFYHPNRDGIEWFCQEVWPRILLEVPDARLEVVGLWGSEVLGSGTTPGVTLHGFAEDLSPWIAESAGLIVPLRIAGGTRLKILEAWAGGLPVVSTTMGAEGLGAVHEETVLLGDQPTELAHGCIRLLRDPQLGVRLATRAFQYGRSRFDWRAIYPAIDQVLATATGQISQPTNDLRSFHI